MTDIIDSAYKAALQNSHPHACLHYMSIYTPELVYVGLVSGSPARGARSITVTNVSGSIASVRAEDTVYVGTLAGSHSKSIRRLKSRVGQVLTIDENSVPWSNGDYITVYHDMRLWGRWPRYSKSGDNYIFYKDYDILYLDQNLRPPPVAVMGWHRAKFMDGGSVSFVLDSSRSYAMADGATIVSRIWTCPTGYIASGTSEKTIVTFTDKGQHEVQLAVTDSNGVTTTTRRIYFAHDRPGPNATYPPFIDFEQSSRITLDWSSGSGRATFRMRGDTVAAIPDNALMVLWGENYFQGSLYTGSIYSGSDYPASIINDGAYRTKFVGYFGRQQIAASESAGLLSIDAYTLDNWMRRTNMASISLTNINNPTKWYEMYKMTVERLVQHYWMYHSNLFSISDVIIPADDLIELYASDDLVDGSLYASADTFAYQHGRFLHVSADKYGRIHLTKDIETLDDADRAAVSTYFTLQKADVKIRDESNQSAMEVVRDTQNRVDLLTIRGFSYSGGTYTPLISQSPGEIPESNGDSSAIMERLVLKDQDEANMWSGRLFYVANRELVEIRITMAGNYYDIMDIAPQYFIIIPDDEFANLMNANTSGKWVLKTINYGQEMHGVTEVELILEPDVESIDGVTIDWPVDPTDIDDPEDRPDPPENPPPPPPPIVPPSDYMHALISSVKDGTTTSSYVYGTDDIAVSSPTWTNKE